MDAKSMKPGRKLLNRIQGWLPKEPSLAYASQASKPRWRKPFWITFVVIAVIALAAVAFVAVSILVRYANPLADVTASYCEKTVNSTTAKVGDMLEVNVFVYWHGYVIPEFKRNVKIIDPFPEGYFSLASENETNVYQSQGHGGSYLFKYSLRVIGTDGTSVEFPEPRLYLDGVEIPLSGTCPTVNIAAS
jgi:hypothetical protein